MYQDNITLCGASAYEKKFYFNQDFNALPDHVKKELQIMCVLYTEDVGGILTLEFDENGRLQFKTEALEADARYDEIRKRTEDQTASAGQERTSGISGNVL